MYGCRVIITPFDSRFTVCAGFDLSSTTDLTSCAFVQLTEDAGWVANWLTWLPQAKLEAAEKRDAAPYAQWAEEGFLTVVPGTRINQNQVFRQSLDVMYDLDCAAVGVDPWNGEWLMSQLEENGIEPVKVAQNYASLSEPCKRLEAAVAEGTFNHGNNPIARWCAENVEISNDTNGNIRPVKPVHGSKKRIDLIAAVVTAMAVALVAGDPLDGQDTQDFAEESLWG